jgi:hypothetical protein
MIAVILVLAAMLPLALAQSNAGIVTVNVNVSTQTWIHVFPNSWTLTQVNPGTDPTSPLTNTSFTIENIGSTNITDLRAYVTNPSENPFATGNASKYNAGNFLAIKTGALTDYRFPNYLEFNDSETWDFAWVTWPTADAKGRFRIGKNEYLWAVAKGTNGDCANGTFYLSSVAKTSDTVGDTNLQDNFVTLTNASGAYGCINVSAPPFSVAPSDLVGHVIRVSPDCKQVALVKSVPSSHPLFVDPALPSCSEGSINLLTGTGSAATGDDALQPGEVIPLHLRITVPYGVRAGDVYPGILYIVAASAA